MNEDAYLTPTDMKSYDYCPRVVFYERCLPGFRPRTYKMDAGRDAHEEESKQSARRTLAKYKLEQGERLFNVRLRSDTLYLDGIIDEVIVTSNAAYPIDYKLARQTSHHYRIQLAAYALLIEENWGITASAGYLLLIGKGIVERVSLDDPLKTTAKAILSQIRQMVDTEAVPPAVPQRSKCLACEFRRVCNDV